MSRPTSRFLWPTIWSLVTLVGLTILLMVNATAREVAAETATMLFGIVSTPFILESTIALMFVCLLMAVNQWRMKKDGDGWVYLVSQEPEAATSLPGSASQRLQGVVMQEKPEAPDDAQTERSLIEGYLELGMPSQAKQELDAQDDLPDDADTALLRVRVLAANLDTEPARQLLRTTTERFPERHPLIAQAVAETCAWFAQHLPTHAQEGRIWHEEARRLGVLHTW